MLTLRNISIVLGMALAMLAPPRAASAACVPIRTIADLDKIRANLAGQFCLMNDLDFTGVANFKPIGDSANPFVGSFAGQGHVIRRLTIVSGKADVGLFGRIDGGRVRNLKLAGVGIHSTLANASAGAIAGEVTGSAAIANVGVTGVVKCLGDGCRVGGIAGQMGQGPDIMLSSVAASVTAGNGGAAGGLVGESLGWIGRSYASGPVVCGSNCSAGGLVGHADVGSVISRSFAVGPVQAADNGDAGGLAATQYGHVARSYATGPVQAGANAIIAGLLAYHGGTLVQGFGIGKVTTGTGDTAGGLIAALAQPQPKSPYSYWDIDVSGQGSSIQGHGLSTVQLQGQLPAGFDSLWDITKGYSYPYLTGAEMPFASTLATVVKTGRVFTFLPLEQREPTEYLNPPAHADSAALAAVYTVVARAIGYTDAVAALKLVKIDRYFWDDSAQTASWTGPVTAHATLGSLLTLGPSDPIDDSNIIGPLKARNVVIVRGQYDTGNGTATHWMLATLFTADSSNVTIALVALDPWTGQQVFIDPTTRQVTRPAGFPLANFKVDGYVVMTLK